MSTYDGSEDTFISTAESGGESSDRSLSDSWTVLDSSHLREDGDLSDAESVEVLAGDDVPAEDLFVQDRCDEAIGPGSSLACEPQNYSGTAVDEDVDAGAKENAKDDADSAEITVSAPNEFTTPSTPMQQSEKDAQKKKWLLDIIVGLALELSIFSLLLDLMFLGLLGFSMAGIDQPIFPLSLKNSKSHQQFEVDPLSLQLSHVLAEWKKRPSEDHSLDRHLLKTLFLYYGENAELSANLQYLTERVQKHNDIMKHSGKDDNTKKVAYNRMVVSGHLAHSVSCVLGKLDSDRPIPADLFKSVNSSDESNDFAPKPGFWLNDWHLPQNFKANDTYYRVETKPIPPPMHNLYLHLGSAKWNQYFWELYHREKEIEDSYEKTYDSDIGDMEVEETERSPLDLNSAGDFVSDEESSGNVLGMPDSPEERVGILYPLFVGDMDGGESAGELLNRKYEDSENFFEQRRSEDIFGKFADSNIEKDECRDESCRKADDTLGHLFQNVEKILDGSITVKVPRKKKGKTKDGKRKSKSLKQEAENLKSKSKQSKKEKQRFDFEDTDSENKKKIRVKDTKKKLKSEGSEELLHLNYYVNYDDKLARDQTHNKKRFAEEKFSDWNTRMAQGREKLRALSEKGDDRMWVFERARARRDLRKETYSE